MPSSPELIDISRPLAVGTAGWPGDVPFTFRFGMRIADGASVNVGAIETSVHTATHCDAPFHFDDAGATIDAIPLDTLVGPCRVVDVRFCLDDWWRKLAHLQPCPRRILFRTGGWPDTSHFPDRIPTMTTNWLTRPRYSGVKLVGVDLPSVDPLDSKTLDVHHALGRHGITILEGLWLEDVPEGRYELFALPLKLVGADGSPVRAVLRPIT